MKTLLLLIALLNAGNYLEAQVQTVVRTLDRSSEMAALKLQRTGTLALTDFSSRSGSAKLLEELNIKGTPYAKEESSMGYFYLGDSLLKIPTRLNYYANGFEFEADGKTFVTTSNTIDSVIVDNEVYVFRVFSLKGERISRAVKIISRQGKNVIYVYRGVEFMQEVKPGPLVDYKPAHFEWNDPIYLFELGDKLITLTNFKELIAAFPGKEKDIQKFIKYNKTSKDNPEELKRLLGYISKF